MPTPLLAPAGAMPSLITSVAEFAKACTEILNGDGPIAIDAERASGYRYSQRAYLIQIKRSGGGLHLIDPIAVGQTSLWSELSQALEDQEWIIHASTQDLPCLRELGLEPKILFDTELGGRIAGCARVGLGPLSESLLEITLAKEHSAVDWSLRPLRDEWLIYAALDVEILIELRDAVVELLKLHNKLDWAIEDFQTILTSAAAEPKKDPWRRTSGMHKIRDRQTLAIIRELWQLRDQFARSIDLSPGRVFNDEALIDIATKRPATIAELARIINRRGRSENPPIEEWHEKISEVLSWPADQYPDLRTPTQGLPPIKMWPEKNSPAYARLTHARAAVLELSLQNSMPPENLISPELVRRLCWNEPALELQAESLPDLVAQKLAVGGARKWQIDLVIDALCKAMLETQPLVLPEPGAQAGPEPGAQIAE